MSDPSPSRSANLVLPRPTAQSVRAFGQTLEPRRAEIEELRRLPPDLVEELIDTGVFRMFVPEALNGHQQPPREALAVIEELAFWDASVAWCAMIGATTGLLAASLPEAGAREIYGSDPRFVTAGVAEPRGTARAVDGGLLASGCWSWGSGAHHSRWISAGCRLEAEDPEAAPKVVVAFFDRDQVTLHDTWRVAGLRGTGSGDFEVGEAFVPERRCVHALGAARPQYDAPLYRFPFFGLLALGVAAVGLGMARRSLAEACELAGGKRYVGSRRTLAQRPAVQAAVGQASAELEASRALVQRAVDAAWRSAREGQLEVDPRRRLREAATFAMRSSVSVVDSMHEIAGGSAVFQSCPLEQLFRDVHVAASHGMVARRTWELTGRMTLGLDTDIRQL